MNAHVHPDADPIARDMLPIIRNAVEAELAKLRRQARQAGIDDEIMAAAAAVGRAADRLEQARFSGAGELIARKAVHTAATRLKTVMRKHGRLA